MFHRLLAPGCWCWRTFRTQTKFADFVRRTESEWNRRDLIKPGLRNSGKQSTNKKMRQEYYLVSLLWKAYSEIKLVSSQIWRYIIFLSQQVPRGLFLSSHQIFGESDTVPVFKNISKCWICTQRVFSISIPNSPPVVQIFCWFRNWANRLFI